MTPVLPPLLAGWLRSGLAWWVDELRGLLPARLTRRSAAFAAWAGYDGPGQLHRHGAGTALPVLVAPELCLVRELDLPPLGQGVWAPFFGRPAYTMTLAARLALQTGARVVLIWGERLSWGRGYRLHTQALGHALSDDLDTAVVQINQAMETLIAQCPAQYIWGYARYKPPRQA